MLKIQIGRKDFILFGDIDSIQWHPAVFNLKEIKDDTGRVIDEVPFVHLEDDKDKFQITCDACWVDKAFYNCIPKPKDVLGHVMYVLKYDGTQLTYFADRAYILNNEAKTAEVLKPIQVDPLM